VALGLPLPLRLMQESSRRFEVSGIDHVSLTNPQRSFIEIDHPRKCWVDGNALGKSFALAAEVVLCILGQHPTWKRRGPLRVLVIGTSYEQMVPLMEKLWRLIPKDELDPRNGFEPGRGITGKPPRLVFVKGRGRGSEIVFATYRAKASRIAGGQYDLVILDEPPPESVYGEVRPRVLAKHGRIILGFTPVPDMPDIAYIREFIAKNKMIRHNVGLREENCWPDSYPAPWHWQPEIDAYANDLLEHERGMRINGDWDPVVTKRLMKDFVESVHVRNVELADIASWKLIVWFDHGTADGKEACMLTAVTGGDTERPEVVYLAERVAEGFTTPEHDAQAAIDMLRDVGLRYEHIDVWGGDVPASSRTHDVRKSNMQIRKEIARLLGRQLHETKGFRDPVKGPSSMTRGARMMNTLFSRRKPDDSPVARIHPRCTQFIAACHQFNGDTHHPLKDVWDSGRYGVESAVTGQVQAVLSARY
jgi:phage terminase large subunit-like protein